MKSLRWYRISDGRAAVAEVHGTRWLFRYVKKAPGRWVAEAFAAGAPRLKTTTMTNQAARGACEMQYAEALTDRN